MGWTTRNNEKSGSYPSLKLAVEIQSSARGTLIQAWLTQFQVRVPMPPKKLPKMAENGLFWPFLALKPILNLVENHEILHAHVVDPN